MGESKQDIFTRPPLLPCKQCEKFKEKNDKLLEACKQAQEWMQRSIKGVNRPASLDKLLIDAIAEAEKGD